jgi:2-amino-4-hydroxy-6-hydroxymethyldihydropteridine diphosphokinase
MAAHKCGYLIGLGSNIDPLDNFARIIELLLHCFDHISLSRVLNIPPVGMNSHRNFLNAVAFIETDMKEPELKTICNQIEIALGRDRSDPDSKKKDRPADLDILTFARFPEDADRPASSITDEYFLYPLIDELKAYLCGRPPVSLQKGSRVSVDNLTLGEAATTIHRDSHAGDKRVV